VVSGFCRKKKERKQRPIAEMKVRTIEMKELIKYMNRKMKRTMFTLHFVEMATIQERVGPERVRLNNTAARIDKGTRGVVCNGLVASEG
jgi:hypothetical protein